MKEVNKVSTGVIKFGYVSNYKAVYEKIRMTLGAEATLFAQVRISDGLAKWLINDDSARYISMKNASPQEKEILLYIWNQKKQELKSLIRRKSPDLENILEIPDSSFIYYREIGNADDIPAHRYSLLVTGWGCSYANIDAGKDEADNGAILAPSTHQQVIVHFLDSEEQPIRNEAFVYKYVEKGVIREIHSDSDGSRDQSICLVGSHFEYTYKKTNQARSFEVLRNVVDYTLKFSPFVSVNLTVVDQNDVIQPKIHIIGEYSGQTFEMESDGRGKASLDKVLFQGDGLYMHFDAAGQNCGDFEIRQNGNDFKLVIQTKEPFNPYLKVIREGQPVVDYVVKVQAESMNASYKTDAEGVIPLSVADGEVMSVVSSENPDLNREYEVKESQSEYVFDITLEEIAPPAVPESPVEKKPSKTLKVINTEGVPMPYYRMTLIHEGSIGTFLCSEDGMIVLPEEWPPFTCFQARDEASEHQESYLIEDNVNEFVFMIPSKKDKQNVYVRVIEQNNSVVPEYGLIVKIGESTMEGRTDANGIFRIGEPEVETSFTVISREDTSVYQTYIVEKGKDEYVFSVIVDEGPIYVTLQDKDNEHTPIPNAHLTLTNKKGNKFAHYTDSEGTIVVPRDFFTDRQKINVHTEISGHNITNCKFRYEKELNHYYITLKNPFPWKQFLSLLALLLLFALLFVKCSKDVTINAVDKAGTPIEAAAINYSYTESHLFKNGDWLYSNEHILYGQTDTDGKVVLENLEYSLYSCIFHSLSKAFIAGQKDDMVGNGSYLFHWKKEYTIVLEAPKTDLTIQVRRAFDKQPIPGATVVADVSDLSPRQAQLTTDVNGECKLEINDWDGEIDVLVASKAGYSGNRITKIDLDTPTEDNDLGYSIQDKYLIIYLEDVKRCSDKGADNTGGKQGNHAVMDYDMGAAGGIFKFSYYTDSAPDVISVYDGSSEDYALGKAKMIFHYDGATDTTTFTAEFTEMLTFTSQTICVVVDNGTNWGYIVHCPQKQ